MHAKSGLRVLLKLKIYRPDSVITAVMPAKQIANFQKELTSIRQTLVPWLRECGRLDHGDPVPAPPDQAYERLVTLSTLHPKNEAILREILTMQCLLCDRHVAAATLRRIIRLPGKRKPKQRHADTTRLKNLEVANPDLLDPTLSMIQMTREEFAKLGQYIDRAADSKSPPRSDTYILTEQWVKGNLGYSEQQWIELRERMWNDGMYNDFYVRDRYFDMIPQA